MIGDLGRYPVGDWSCLPVLIEEEQAGADMNHKEQQQANPEDAYKKHVTVQLLGVALKSGAAQIEGGNAGDMAAEKEQQQQAAYGHEPFFTNGRGEKSDKPHGRVLWMDDGEKNENSLQRINENQKKKEVFLSLSNFLELFMEKLGEYNQLEAHPGVRFDILTLD